MLADALEPFRSSSLLGPSKEESCFLPYLQEKRVASYFDIQLSVDLRAAGAKDFVRISTTNSAYLAYSFNQMLAHHTITGCQMNTGDLLGGGTISGLSASAMGSLLEMTENGKTALHVGAQGTSRKWLEDGDTVRMSGLAGQRGSFVGFGGCHATITPARNPLHESY